MERSVKLKLRIDFKAMKYYNMYNLIYRKHFIWFYIILSIVCFGGCFISFAGAFIPGFRDPNILFAVIFGLFTIYLVYQTINLEATIDRNIANYFYNRRPIEQNLIINDESITIVSPTDSEKRVTYDWLNVTKIFEIPQYFYLYLGKQPLIIDKDPNAILEGSYDDLIAIIMDKASVKPYKKTDKEVVKRPITFVHQEFVEEKKEENQETIETKEVSDSAPDQKMVDDAEEIKVEIENAGKEEAGNPEAKDK